MRFEDRFGDEQVDLVAAVRGMEGNEHWLLTVEWRAWHRVVIELRALGVDINNEARLHAALKVWSELNALLRGAQEKGAEYSSAVIGDHEAKLNDTTDPHGKDQRG